jgi:hypothetical protein
MFLEGLIKTIRAPYEFVRVKVFGIQTAKGQLKGEVLRVKQAGELYKDGAKQAGGAAQKLKSGQNGQNGKAGKKKKAAKMGLFSKKKKCPSCSEKLHSSWDQCPYCGWSEAPAGPTAAPVTAAPAGGKMRTMAIDAAAAGTTPIGSAVGWLVPLDGPQSGELFQLRGRAIVGTAADCDVVLREPSISGRHAEFMSASGGFRVNDLGSTNGTYVNDKRVTTSDLIDNDNVRLGRVNFKFKSMS